MDCVLSLPNSYVEVLTPEPQCLIPCGNRVLTDVISSDEVIMGSGGLPIQYDRCPYQIGTFGHRHA